jgi:hypothetical protein
MKTTKTYIGSKIIQGEPMDELECAAMLGRDVNAISISPEGEARPGYLVIYEDGYKSWSPKETFENAYREMTPGEKALI